MRYRHQYGFVNGGKYDGEIYFEGGNLMENGKRYVYDTPFGRFEGDTGSDCNAAMQQRARELGIGDRLVWIVD